MAVTLANLITNLDTNIGDSSTDRISQAERFQALTEAVVWLNEELGNDHNVSTQEIDFIDTVNYYKITALVPDIQEPTELRRAVGKNYPPFTRKDGREIASEIAEGSQEPSYAIEYQDDDWYLGIIYNPQYQAQVISEFDSLTDGGGTWQADTTNSDATNVTIDTAEYTSGNGSLNFDVDVSQSGNNRATIYNEDANSADLSDLEDLASWVFEAYIPNVTNFSSITFYWGTDSSNYWSATVTTDINGSAFANGDNTIKVNWADATPTGTPDAGDITYYRFDFNYTVSQGDDTDFRLDYLRVVRPEKLTFRYVSWVVGKNNSGTDIYAFSATTDVPFFSGKYDQYKYAIAHKAAGLLFKSPLRLYNDALVQEDEANKQLERARKIFPTSKTPEEKNFKVRSINFNRRYRYRR